MIRAVGLASSCLSSRQSIARTNVWDDNPPARNSRCIDYSSRRTRWNLRSRTSALGRNEQVKRSASISYPKPPRHAAASARPSVLCAVMPRSVACYVPRRGACCDTGRTLPRHEAPSFSRSLPGFPVIRCLHSLGRNSFSEPCFHEAFH